MKLNPDCIRAVLIYLEENLEINGYQFKEITLHQLQEGLPQYAEDDVFYSVYNLHQIHFIEGRINFTKDGRIGFCEINNITWNGHQFLNTIRPKTIWDATKNGASKLGVMSMHALSTISMEISKALVTHPSVISQILENIT